MKKCSVDFKMKLGLIATMLREIFILKINSFICKLICPLRGNGIPSPEKKTLIEPVDFSLIIIIINFEIFSINENLPEVFEDRAWAGDFVPASNTGDTLAVSQDCNQD